MKVVVDDFHVLAKLFSACLGKGSTGPHIDPVLQNMALIFVTPVANQDTAKNILNMILTWNSKA